MRNKLNDEIVDAIRTHLHPDENIVAYLMSLLSLGRESIYRRLRSEIPFTFEEVSILSSNMGFSIDSLLKLKKTERVLYYVDLNEQIVSEKVYYEKLLQYTQFFAETRKCKSVKRRFAKNYIPLFFSLNYPALTKFKYYKWVHQMLDVKPDFAMSDLVMPQDITDLQKQWGEIEEEWVNTTYIFDDNIFLSLIKDINYFYKRGLINESEIRELEDSLLDLVEELELMAKSGKHRNGSEVLLYILHLDLSAAYSHVEYDNNTASHILLHNADILKSNNPRVCQVQKDWINLLKRYSVLITQSGEMQRFEYFKRQREYIKDTRQMKLLT